MNDLEKLEEELARLTYHYNDTLERIRLLNNAKGLLANRIMEVKFRIKELSK